MTNLQKAATALMQAWDRVPNLKSGIPTPFCRAFRRWREAQARVWDKELIQECKRLERREAASQKTGRR